MTWKRVVLEIGMGTDIRGADSTKAAVRAQVSASLLANLGNSNFHFVNGEDNGIWPR